MTKQKLEVDLKTAKITISELSNIVNGPYDYDRHQYKTWKKYYEEKCLEVKHLEYKLEKVETTKKDILSLKSEEIYKFQTELGKLENEIKHLKDLKQFGLLTNDAQTKHTIEAESYYKDENYTIFIIGLKEIFKIKTDLITSMHIREY